MTQVVDNTTVDTTNRNATSTGSTEPAGESHEPPVESEPPRHESGTASQVRTPSENASGGEVQGVAASHEGATGDELEGGGTDDEERRTSTSTDETAVTSAAHAYTDGKRTKRTQHAVRGEPGGRSTTDRRVEFEGQEGRGR